MGLIKFKVKITKKGYRVNPYNLFACMLGMSLF